MREADLTSDDLHSVLILDVETGLLTWRERPASMFRLESDCRGWNRRMAGKPAFTANSNGYRQGSILGLHTVAHRVIWCMVHGAWPSDRIDHINQDKADNRPINLRDVTQAINGRNMGLRRTNTSGEKNIRWEADRQRWLARVNLMGTQKMVNVGRFKSLEEAVAARDAATVRFGLYNG